jgi:iron complex transport system substrate-binding protein
MLRIQIKSILSLLMIGSLLLLLVGCGSQAATPETPQDQGTSIELIDMLDRPIQLNGPANKIVALQPADVEIIYALGAEASLVGVGEFCNYPAAAQEKVVLSSGAQTNIETIVALDPDVVIMSTLDQSEEQIAQLTRAGMKVVLTNAQDILGTYQAIELIGQVVDRPEQATALVTDLKNKFAELKEKAAKQQNKTIYFEVSPLQYGLWTAGKQTFMQEMADLLGLENIFADIDGWAPISEEQVISRNPDIIVTITMFYGEGPKPEEEIMERKAWANVQAIKNKAIYNGDSDRLTRPGPRLAQGAEDLYQFVEQYR